jgi:hypothetical protein
MLNLTISGRDVGVSIVTRYGLGGQGIESRWRQDLPHPTRTAMGPTQPLIQWVTGLLPGVKRQGLGADHPPRFSAEVQ